MTDEHRISCCLHKVPPIKGRDYDNAHVSIVFYAYRLRQKARLVFQAGIIGTGVTGAEVMGAEGDIGVNFK